MGEQALSDRFFSQNILQIVKTFLKDTSQRIKEHTLIRQSGERSQAGSTGWWLGVRWEPGSKMAKSDPKPEEGKVRNWNKSSEQSVWWRVKNETGPHLNLPPQCTGARKIGPVPQQVLSPRWKIRKECNVCDTASAFKSFNHPGIAPYPPPSPLLFPLFLLEALTPFTPGHDALSSPRLPHDLPRSVERKKLKLLDDGRFGRGLFTVGRRVRNWGSGSAPNPTTNPGIPMGKFLLALPPHNYINQNQNTKYKIQNADFKFQNTKFLLALHWPNYINKYLNY